MDAFAFQTKIYLCDVFCSQIEVCQINLDECNSGLNRIRLVRVKVMCATTSNTRGFFHVERSTQVLSFVRTYEIKSPSFFFQNRLTVKEFVQTENSVFHDNKLSLDLHWHDRRIINTETAEVEK